MSTAKPRRLFLLFASVTAACTDVERSTGPERQTGNVNAVTLRNAANGPKVRIAVRPEVSTIGCAIVGRDSEGNAQVASISRGLVATIVGTIDSIDAPMVKGRPTTGSLHVVTGSFTRGQPARSYVVNCLAPESLSQTAFSRRLASSAKDGVWGSALAQLRQYAAGASRSDAAIASDILLEKVRSGGQPRFVPTPSSATTTNLGGRTAPRLDFECGPGTDYACGQPTLPTVTVTARPGYPIIVDMSELFWSRRIYSLSDLAGVWFYEGPDCSNASQTWISMNSVVQQMEEQADAMGQATNEVAQYTCEPQYTEGGSNLCLDLFIMSERAAFLIGDNRDFDPNAPFKASRAQLYVNPEQCTVQALVNTSRTVEMPPFGNGPYAPHTMNTVTAVRDGADCVVNWKLLTGWCEGTVPNFVCPAIDGSLRIRSDGHGGWSTSIYEDKFPSRGLYWWRGDHFETISEREETIWLDLFSWRRSIDKMRIERDRSLPPGCELE